MRPLFCYGTLMYPPLLVFLTAPGLRSVDAQLAGYRCLQVRRADFPAIAVSAGAVVKGLLVRDIPPAAWQRLDRYEGEMYRRTAVQVELGDGGSAEAWTYVIRPRFHARLGQREWQYGREAENYAKTQLATMISAAQPKR